jgi:hypothetical protein
MKMMATTTLLLTLSSTLPFYFASGPTPAQSAFILGWAGGFYFLPNGLVRVFCRSARL